MSSEAAAHSHAPTVSRSRLPDPGEPIPALAAPTVALFVAAALLFGGSTALALSGAIPYLVAIAINTISNIALGC
ncbi:MAG: hypothetical protein WBF18_12455 [Solirubrobacterales bacterium]